MRNNGSCRGKKTIESILSERSLPGKILMATTSRILFWLLTDIFSQSQLRSGLHIDNFESQRVQAVKIQINDSSCVE